ncbi:MAG TPA: hypothetical protein VJ376_13100, partial [Pseudomonadota bacterium]|nr:hypothetical protein [Pseudomonadota bacterium]
MPHRAVSGDPLTATWRRVGRTLALIASAILAAIVIVHGESWAIRQAPLLTDSAIAVPVAGCIPDEAAEIAALP